MNGKKYTYMTEEEIEMINAWRGLPPAIKEARKQTLFETARVCKKANPTTFSIVLVGTEQRICLDGRCCRHLCKKAS